MSLQGGLGPLGSPLSNILMVYALFSCNQLWNQSLPEFGRLFKTPSSNGPLPRSFPHRVKSEREKTWLKSSSSTGKGEGYSRRHCFPKLAQGKEKASSQGGSRAPSLQTTGSGKRGTRRKEGQRGTDYKERRGARHADWSYGGGSPGRSTPASCSRQDKRGRDLCLALGAAECAWGRTFWGGDLHPSLGYPVSCQHQRQR